MPVRPLQDVFVLFRLISTAFILGVTISTAAAQPKVEVTVEGIDGELRENVVLLLSIYQQRDHPDLTAGRINRLHEKAETEIRHALEPFAYYRPHITSELSQDRERWHARYQIDSGPRLPIASLNLQLAGPGANEIMFTNILSQSQLKVGEPFLHAEYERIKSALLRAADSIGYFDARFSEHEVLIDLPGYQAQVALTFSTGIRYQFGEIRITGDIALNEAMVRRFITFGTGEPFDSALLLDLQDALSKSDYFATVDIRIERQLVTGQQVPITVALSMRNRTRYAIGFGYGTDTGPRGSLNWEQRFLNTQGHHFSADLKASQSQSSVGAKYIVPLTRPRSDRIVGRAEYSIEHLNRAKRRTQLMEIADEHVKNSWQRRYTLTYQLEDFDIGLDQGISQLFMPGLAFSYLAGDDTLHVDQGVRFNVELRGARENLLSDANFVQGRIAGKYIYGVPMGRFITRVDIGATRTRQFSELPPTIRFFAGGDYSVRGYAYKSIGPRDASDIVVGGESLLVTSVEYEQFISAQWSGAVFFDAGNAYHENPHPFKTSRGLGIRRKLPFGWLRLDLAQALQRTDDPWRIHLTLGPDL